MSQEQALRIFQHCDKVSPEAEDDITTGSFTASGLRNEAVTGLFLDFWGPQRLLWTFKDGCILHLGKKHTFLGLVVSPGGWKKKNKFKIWWIGHDIQGVWTLNSAPIFHFFIWLPVFSICYNEEMKDNIKNQSNQRRNHVQDTLYIKPNSPDLGICPFSDHHLDSPLNLKLCGSYLKVIYAHPWVSKEAFGDLRSPKTSP